MTVKCGGRPGVQDSTKAAAKDRCQDRRTLAGAGVLGGGRDLPTACATALCGGRRTKGSRAAAAADYEGFSTETEAASNQLQPRLPISGAVVVSGGRCLTLACLMALNGGRRTKGQVSRPPLTIDKYT